ncbi:MAG: universal stress protein [Alphaproteobacteria bacterium]|nr:universal stress protein [Alphaproteobacteria bacterium]
MKRFKKILLVCDQAWPSKAVVERARGLAKANGATLTLMHVIQRDIGDHVRFLGGMTDRAMWDLEQQVLQDRHEQLQQLEAAMAEDGIPVDCVVAHGIKFIEIIRQVLRTGHDLVMKEATGRHEGARLFFGSLDLHLLRKCPCPVWIIKQSQRKQYARVLAAVDPHGADDERDALNVLIMDLATSLSAMEMSELHVVNAWRLSGEESLRSSPFLRMPDGELDRLVRLERKHRKTMFDELVADYEIENRRRQLHLVKGDARKVIPEIARKKRVELIVMGTVARTGISGLFIGNTAEAILSQIDCSVLAVKPDGFETPVTLEDAATARDGPADLHARPA